MSGEWQGAVNNMSDIQGNIELPNNEKEPNKRLTNLEGIWSELGFDVTAEDIAEARREMWGNFPRDIRDIS